MKTTEDDVAAANALLIALGYDPAIHAIVPRRGKTMMGIQIVRADGSMAEFFTQKELRQKMENPFYAKRWAEARGEVADEPLEVA